jgi:hypothetical protein
MSSPVDECSVAAGYWDTVRAEELVGSLAVYTARPADHPPVVGLAAAEAAEVLRHVRSTSQPRERPDRRHVLGEGGGEQISQACLLVYPDAVVESGQLQEVLAREPGGGMVVGREREREESGGLQGRSRLIIYYVNKQYLQPALGCEILPNEEAGHDACAGALLARGRGGRGGGVVGELVPREPR